MKWPWVSRLAYDTVVAERDRLIAENRELRDHVQRVERHARGMSEVPRAPKVELGLMPDRLRHRIAGFQNPSLQREMTRTAWRRRYRGEDWDDIERDMTKTQSIEEALP